MKTGIAIALLGICVLSGCTSSAHFYPVQGPLGLQSPPPIYTAKITLVANWSKPVTVGVHVNDKQGKIFVVLGNGEQFSGQWKLVYGATGTQSAVAGSQQTNSLAAAWDTVYGKGFYTAHVLGTPLFVHTELTGNQGTVLQVEWYEYGVDHDGAQTMLTEGIATDSKGNIYKLVF